MASLTASPSAQTLLTSVKSHWFKPFLFNTDNGTLAIGAYTDSYNGGSSPWTVTLTSNAINSSGKPASTVVPIASYTTGYNFQIDETAQATNNTYAILYDRASAGDATNGVDVLAQTIDDAGNPIGAPSTLLSDVDDVKQFHVAAKASGGTSYDLVYSTYVPKSGTEQVHYQVFNADGTAIAGDAGVLDTIATSGSGNLFGFGTLVPAPLANPTYIYFRESNKGNIGLAYELVGIDGRATTSLAGIAPVLPAGATSQSLLDWRWDRLNPTTAGGADLVTIQRYGYTDASGAAQEAIDVHTMNAVTGGAANNVVIPVALGSSGLAEIRLATGGFVIGYGGGAGNPSLLQEFDANGNEVGAPVALPSDETQINLDALPDGRVIVGYSTATATGGNQLAYDIYDTRQAPVVVDLAADGAPTTAVGTPFDDVFYLGGGKGADTVAGGGGIDFIVTSQMAGSGTALVDLKDGYAAKGSQVDAELSGIQGVTLGAGPSVVLGLTSGTDLLYGGAGDDQIYNEGAIDYIQGGTGSNEIVGGNGTTIFYGNGGVDTMRGGTGQNFLQAGPTTASKDVFYGTGGTDFVYGGPGATELIGGSGTEDLTGGAGSNQLIGSNQSTSALNIFNGGSGTDVFDAGVGTNLLYEGTGTDVLAGNAGTDYVYGGAGHSFIYGGSGTDVITTGAADQYIKAGSGSTFFNDTAANLRAGRFDQIDNFAGGQGTNLYMPTAELRATTFVAQAGGTAVLTAVGGGTAEIFAAGADIATVQAHTHFTL